jgi:diaminopimelate epimerase
MQLTKHHGLGNDFLVVADPTAPVDATLARALCDRHRGVGADGLLHLTAGTGTDLRMVLLNADGGRAEMSGNGIGCLVQAAVRAGMADGPVVTVATDAGTRTVEIHPGASPNTHVVTVGMGAADIADTDEPEWATGDILRARRVGVGNPHLVLHAADADLLNDRTWVEFVGRRAHDATAGGINVEVIAAGDADGELRMDVYERGVGLTFACGTGACASAAAARHWGLAGDHVVVRMAGGPTSIDLTGDEIRMTTPITYVASMEVPWPAS